MGAVIDRLDDLEIGLCLRVNRYGDKTWVRKFFSIVSKLGDGGYWVAMGLLLIAMQGSSILPYVAKILLTTVVGVGTYKLLKHKLVRERPYIAHNGICLGTAPLDQYSFPSGHTLHAACLTTFLVHAEAILVFVTLPFALLVAVSRIVLGLHYPSDVVVGAALGVGLATVSISLL